MGIRWPEGHASQEQACPQAAHLECSGEQLTLLPCPRQQLPKFYLQYGKYLGTEVATCSQHMTKQLFAAWVTAKQQLPVAGRPGCQLQQQLNTSALLNATSHTASTRVESVKTITPRRGLNHAMPFCCNQAAKRRQQFRHQCPSQDAHRNWSLLVWSRC